MVGRGVEPGAGERLFLSADQQLINCAGCLGRGLRSCKPEGVRLSSRDNPAATGRMAVRIIAQSGFIHPVGGHGRSRDRTGQ